MGVGAISLASAGGSNYGKIQVESFSGVGTGTWSLGYGANSGQTLGTSVLTWKETGNAGIGTTGPLEKLSLYNTISSTNTISWMQRLTNFTYDTTTGVGAGIKFKTTYDGDANGWAGIAGVSNDTYGQSAELAFYTNRLSAAPTEKVRIDKNGNAGIGRRPQARF